MILVDEVEHLFREILRRDESRRTQPFKEKLQYILSEFSPQEIYYDEEVEVVTTRGSLYGWIEPDSPKVRGGFCLQAYKNQNREAISKLTEEEINNEELTFETVYISYAQVVAVFPSESASISSQFDK